MGEMVVNRADKKCLFIPGRSLRSYVYWTWLLSRTRMPYFCPILLSHGSKMPLIITKSDFFLLLYVKGMKLDKRQTERKRPVGCRYRAFLWRFENSIRQGEDEL